MNAAAESQGGEIELTLFPIDNLEIYTSIGIAKGTYVEFRSGLGNFDGNEFEDAPQENYVLGFEYGSDKFSIGANAEYTGEYYVDVQNTQEIDNRTITDLVVYLSSKPISEIMLVSDRQSLATSIFTFDLEFRKFFEINQLESR